MKDNVIKALAASIKERADQIETAEDVINERLCWNLRDDDDSFYSTNHMSDDDLQAAAVEDLLNVVQHRMEGKEVGGDIEYFLRFLTGASKERARAAFEADFVKSLVVVLPNGHIELNPEYMQDAMDFAGVWIEGWEPLTTEPVYYANPRL